jgi:hypothetical protein
MLRASNFTSASCTPHFLEKPTKSCTQALKTMRVIIDTYNKAMCKHKIVLLLPAIFFFSSTRDHIIIIIITVSTRSLLDMRASEREEKIASISLINLSVIRM